MAVADERTPWAQRLAPGVRRFLETEVGGAAALLGAALVALVWANLPGDSYAELWSTEVAVSAGDSTLEMDLRHWVNDGLMVFFFFVIGLEVRRELTMGELTDRRRAAAPMIAAAAGLLLPALIYLAINPSGEAARGWGAAMATDTAFVLGVLALVGPRCPARLRLFLLTLAVVDDIGALAAIAVFYTDDLQATWLLAALAGVGAILVLRRLRVWRAPAYFAVALVVWGATYESGVHPTIVGVLLGLLTTAWPPERDSVERAAELARAFRQSPSASLARSAKLSVEAAVSPNERLQELLHPWTSYVVVPVFALANAGIALDGDALADAAGSPVALGIVAGLVAGKLIGIFGATFAAVKLGVARLPGGVGKRQLAGGAALSGIGFTVSLFIVDLAFADGPVREQATLGVLAAAPLAALAGWAIFRLADRSGEGAARAPMRLDAPVDPERDHVRGPLDVPLTLVEYADFECPFCGEATGSIAELREALGDRLRYVFRHLPLDGVHPHARLAAEASEAAAAQGRFWDMHDLLYARQDALEPGDLVGYAAELGLDVDRFASDLAEGRFAERVRDDVASAGDSGATGTPTFFVGEERHIGPYDAATLRARLEALGSARQPA